MNRYGGALKRLTDRSSFALFQIGGCVVRRLFRCSGGERSVMAYWKPVVRIQNLVNLFGGEERIERFESGELVLVDRATDDPGPLLKFEGNVPLVGGRFVAKQAFTMGNTKVKFCYIDERIPKLFGGVKEDVAAGQLGVHTLRRPSHDPDIMVAMGPQPKRFVSIGQYYYMLEAQGQGQEGPLLINGYANIGYVMDENGAVWVLDARWYSDGWYVGLRSVARRSGWGAGRRALSQVA